MAKGKIIVMRLFGGLGNQLFQYAFLFALSRQGGKARLETSSYEHDDKRVCELHHFRVSLPIEGGPPPWAFRKSRIPACLRSLFAAPKYPHFREEKRHGFDPGLAAPPRRHCNAPRHLIELRQVSYITCLSASSVQGVCIDSASPLQAASRSPQSTVSSSSLTTPSRSILSLASASRCITLARSLAG